MSICGISRISCPLPPAGVTVAHGFGRLGCPMAGCCYGRATDARYGIEMVGIGKRIPVQLFEAIFLFLLCGWLVIRYCEGRQCGMPLYMMLYGTWRFFAEYLRDDYRGNSLISFRRPLSSFHWYWRSPG